MSDPERILERRFPADPQELRAVRSAVRDSLLACGTRPACAEDCVMAIDEACQNIIRHAYGGHTGDILLEIERVGDELVVCLTDFAPPVDRSRVKPRDLDDVRPGGLGTHLMREVMDRVEFAEPPPGCGNLLRMVKRIA
jgi:sigma-B regulation protein RsbU (phosphoserine phosphatase)